MNTSRIEFGDRAWPELAALPGCYRSVRWQVRMSIRHGDVLPIVRGEGATANRGSGHPCLRGRTPDGALTNRHQPGIPWL
ncbi:hypothetical protein PJI17_27845 [Mycobacterium kansasii]